MRILRGARPGILWTPLAVWAPLVLGVAPVAVLAGGCALATFRTTRLDRDFFPLAPNSRWEYAVARSGGTEKFRFVATVRPNDFRTADVEVGDQMHDSHPARQSGQGWRVCR